METRRLGRIGHESSVLIYGGAALSHVDDEVADASIRLALDAGINHFDTAAGYGDSELQLGRWMPRIRDRIFLATKTGDRTEVGAYDSVRRSLERLHTDRVDLIQLHAVGNLDELDAVTARTGALAGVERAREEGLVGAIGITGHGIGVPEVHLEALRRHPFDTVLTPWNWRLDGIPEFRRAFRELVDETQRQNAGLMIIKTVARGLWKQGESQTHSTWYEPLIESTQIGAAVAFVLSEPSVTGICTPGDVGLLPAMIDAEARRDDWTPEGISAELEGVADLDTPFLRKEGHVMPGWMEHLVPG